MSVCSPSLSPLSLPIQSFTEKAKSLSQIQQAHAFMLKTGLFHDTFSASKLITFAVENPEPKTVSYAHSILNRIENPNAFTHNSVIRAYANSSSPELALMAFQEMLLGGVVWPDKYSFTFVLKACGVFCGGEEGRQIHGLWLKSGLESDVFVENTLVNVYGRCGWFEIARKVLDEMSVRDVVSWNSLLSAFVEKGLVEEARELFDEMEERNVESWNFMISGYAGVGLVKEAKEVFDLMPVKDVVSWNAMMSCYADGGCYDEVLEVFNEMLGSGEEPDGFTFVNVLSACANLGSLSQGEWVHVYVDKNGIAIEGFLATALVDMYSKCGKIDKALEVFRGASKKDVSTWNSMITGLSVHGLGNDALEIFYEMVHEGFKPNSITFIAILSACNHVGLLDQARNLFETMNSVYGIEPTVEHYGCMVDLLGRMGKFEEAEELVNQVPEDEALVVLESLLGACKRFGRMEQAKRLAKRLLELNPHESSGYVQMSNLYASNGRWDEVKEVRKKMRAERVNKKPGCSMIEVDGVVHEFLAGEGLIQDSN